MAPHTKRILAELDTLSASMAKQWTFIKSAAFDKLPRKTKKLWHKQMRVMAKYKRVLIARLALDGVKHEQ